MARKTDILALLKQELEKIDKGLETRIAVTEEPYKFKTKVHHVFKNFKYIDEIDDRPSICFYISNEARRHIGGGIRYAVLTIDIRGYAEASMADRSSAINVADDLLEDIEVIVNGISYLDDACAHDIEECRVLRLFTDEGLFDPDAIAHMTVELIFQLDTSI